MAARHFKPSDLVLVLVGNVKAFQEPIRKEFPKARFTELAFEKVNVLTPDLGMK